MKKYLIAALLSAGAILIPGTAAAAEINVYNNSSEPANLYFDDGHGWEFYQMIPAKNSRRYQSEPGETWGFDNPETRRLDIVSERTVKQWGINTLTLTDRDIGHDGHNHGGGGGGGGGGRPDLNPLNNTISIANNSSLTVDVYADHGNGWHKEATLAPRSRNNFHAYKGDDWAIDDPNRRGVNVVKSLTIRNFDLLPSITVYDQDFGINPNQILPFPPPGPKPAPVERTITLVNNSSRTLNMYNDDGRGWYRQGSLSPGRSKQFKAPAGEPWGFDDPKSSGVDIIKQGKVSPWSRSTTLAITDRDLNGGGGFFPPPRPLPAPVQDVSITFKNKSIHKANVHLKTGAFSKSYLGTIGRLSKDTFKLKPGQTVIINRPGELGALKYTVPSENSYIEFKPR